MEASYALPFLVLPTQSPRTFWRNTKLPVPVTDVDGFTIGAYGNRHAKKTTQGWELNMKIKEGFSKWVSLKDVIAKKIAKRS